MTRLVLTAVLIAAPATAAAQTISPTSSAKIDSIFAQHRGTDRPGCAVGAVQRGKPVFARGYGMADMAQSLAITPSSIFHVASVSKQFAGMSIVLLAQAGKLSLDDAVRKYLPEFPAYEQPITIRQFLTHTSGVRDQWNLLIASGWRLGDDLITEQDVKDVVYRQRTLNFTPGSYWNYSNTGFTLAGAIVKQVTGQTLRQFADSALFRPLGMTRTHFHDDNLEIVPGRTRGYTRRSGVWKETVPNYSTVGATSLFTTVEDLARWQNQLQSGIVGGRSAIETLTTRGVLNNGDTLSYALGIMHGRYRGTPTIGHSGGDPGYSSHLLHFPRTGSGVSVLCNTSGSANPSRLAEQVADVLLADELGPEPTLPPQVPAAKVASAVGLYWSEGAEAVGRIAVDSNGAVWRPFGSGTPLRVSGTEGTFLLGGGPVSITLRPDGTLLFRGGMGEPTEYARVTEWTPTAADRAALVGRYYSPELDVTWEIRTEGDSLMVHRRKFPPVKLTPLFRDTYTAAGVLRAVRGPGGRVTGITAGSGRVVRMVFDRVTEKR
jgi:CubicO group peptidase (beta-lactamase class C family)